MLGCAREKRRRRNSGNVPEHCERGRPVRGVSRVTTLRLSSGHTRIHTQQGMYDDERAEGTVISRCIVSRASPALYFYHTPTTRPGKRAPWPMYTAPDVRLPQDLERVLRRERERERERERKRKYVVRITPRFFQGRTTVRRCERCQKGVLDERGVKRTREIRVCLLGYRSQR